jgi:putative intracellular protease/amidase
MLAAGRIAAARELIIMWRRIRRIALWGAAALLVLCVAGYVYVGGYALDEQPPADPGSTPADLVFLRDALGDTRRESRGRVLAVVTSTATIGDSGRKAGYELTELSRAYYVFRANGYEVDIASPRGGEPPMKLDEDLDQADHAFLNDADARRKLKTTLRLSEIDASRYEAVYFVGGKGTMFDFPDDADIQRIVRTIHARGGVIGAVCHGPAALLNVRLDDGSRLLSGRRVAGFSNDEELFLIENARELFPYLLQDALRDAGARYVEGPMYLDNTVVDDRLVTGQNPWSTWSVAEAMVRAMGHAPVARPATREEHAVRVLLAYHRQGDAAARAMRAGQPDADRRLILMHALIAGMRGDLGDAFRLQRLARP